MTTRNWRPRLRAKPDYIALGPIFPTTLKSMRFAPQGIPKITEWKKRIGDIPLVAIGGIKFEQAAEIFAAGADSIAVVSDVTQNADPDARVRQWLGAERGGRVMCTVRSPVPFIPPSSPGLTGRSSTPRPLRPTAQPLGYWIPAFAGMTAVAVSRSAMPTN